MCKTTPIAIEKRALHLRPRVGACRDVDYARLKGITKRLRERIDGAHYLDCSAPRAVIPMAM